VLTDAVVLPGRDAVDTLRAALAASRTLIEPRRENGILEWVEMGESAASGGVSQADLAPFDWDVALPLPSPKRFFFPPREALLRWRGESMEEVLPAPRPFVLFGLRSCDATAIAYQDRFFAADPAYVRRRAAALLVVVQCTSACAGGFCVDVDAGPFASSGFDLALTLLPDDRVLLEIGSPEGGGAVAAAKLRTATADARVRAMRHDVEGRARASFPERPFIARARARLDAGEIRDDEWQALGPACLACTGCTSLCPTCSCFTVVDEAAAGGGERARYWDSCLLEGFQREASGHHPAPRAGDRVRRFWYHKFSADFVRDFGRVGCVGCGRCDVTCPGSIGALRVLERLGT
jgi:formate hydrogenlyase subunit 6/NADH:ubiquinone oxidoreductase subunit I